MVTTSSPPWPSSARTTAYATATSPVSTPVSDVQIVGTCDKLDDPSAPAWSKVHLANVEAFGGGTLAYDPVDDRIAPHVHVAVGLREHSATGHTSHLLGATVQFLTEMLVVEVAAPQMRRVRQPDLYDLPLLRFGPNSE